LQGPAYESIDQRARFYRQLEDRFREAQEFRATLASHAPFEGSAYRRLSIDGRAAADGNEPALVRVVTVSQNYFDVLGTRAVRGTPFSGLDDTGSLMSAIVNDQFAARYFDGRDAIGHRLGLAALNRDPDEVSIVGVASDIRQASTEAQQSFEPIVYISYVGNPLPEANVLVRSRLGAGAIAAQVREQVRAIDPGLALYDVMRLEESFALSDERLGLRVFGGIFVVVGVIALVLATVGLYAVTAYATAQRTREIGIRVALGSTSSQIGWLIMRQAWRQLAIGLAIGMAGALGINRLLRGVLIGVGSMDYGTLIGVALLLVAVTLIASFVPARRAMRLNPVNALRNS
jgi:hypothetical protein